MYIYLFIYLQSLEPQPIESQPSTGRQAYLMLRGVRGAHLHYLDYMNNEDVLICDIRRSLNLHYTKVCRRQSPRKLPAKEKFPYQNLHSNPARQEHSRWLNVHIDLNGLLNMLFPQYGEWVNSQVFRKACLCGTMYM